MCSELDVMDNWKHRSEYMLCDKCMWFVPKGMKDPVTIEDLRKRTEDNKFVGRCRRHAPQLNGWPTVFNNDWCGDHKLDEDKI